MPYLAGPNIVLCNPIMKSTVQVPQSSSEAYDKKAVTAKSVMTTSANLQSTMITLLLYLSDRYPAKLLKRTNGRLKSVVAQPWVSSLISAPMAGIAIKSMSCL